MYYFFGFVWLSFGLIYLNCFEFIVDFQLWLVARFSFSCFLFFCEILFYFYFISDILMLNYSKSSHNLVL